mmetsp:Transcript_12695/g.38278  ORF Transcript_12695/g.38278 Transcript_12695/m.38278 type:complete len:131 (-) Transcript_12695:3984-4376(-)
MSDQLRTLDANLKTEAEAYQQIQKELQKNATAHKQFTAQLSENELVLKELDKAEGETGGVFKLVGPTLIRQDPHEARSNVGKRLEFIRRELDRLSGQADSLTEKHARKQRQIANIQSNIQEVKAKMAPQQ